MTRSKLGVPLDKLLLFWQDKELTPAYDARTLLELNLHTGGRGGGGALWGGTRSELPGGWRLPRAACARQGCWAGG